MTLLFQTVQQARDDVIDMVSCQLLSSFHFEWMRHLVFVFQNGVMRRGVVIANAALDYSLGLEAILRLAQIGGLLSVNAVR